MTRKKLLAICDLDGTLFDTNEINYYAYKEALNYYGVDIDFEYFVNECSGKSYKDFLPIILKNKIEIEKVHTLKKNAYSKHLDKARLNIHLIKIIENIRNDYYISLVTTASKKNTMDILEYFNVTGLFDLIITSEDVTKVKPDPEGFIKAMEHFSIDSTNTIVFEDSSVGIDAAIQAGAQVFRVEGF